jgi:hypothetical protein
MVADVRAFAKALAERRVPGLRVKVPARRSTCGAGARPT